jgi:nucleotide-binding universal stress UspA family protein
VLCPVGARPETVALLDWAAEFCMRVGASLNVLHVIRPIADWPTVAWEAEMQEELRQAAHARIAALQAEARVEAPMRVLVGEIAATIAERAREDEADLILIGRGAVQAALGRLRTHAYGIIQRSPCPVLSV